MLFSYTYVPHKMDKMQEFIDFIFYEVWCKAPIGLAFHTDLFKGNSDLKDVMSEFGFSAQAAPSGKAFYKSVKTIYELFAALATCEIEQFKHWYQGNNDLERLCANNPAVQLARYADIAVTHKDMSEQMAVFFKALYSLLGLAALRDKIGDIDDHYKTFVSINNKGKCPFCGISDLYGKYQSKREAYDHYLPKSLYPFNSSNFRNLVPACHHCNSSYKTSKDPAFKPKDPAGEAVRRKAFYPFSTVPHVIDLQVTLKHMNYERWTSDDIHLTFGPAEISEQIDTWKDVYGIEEQYCGKLLGGDGKAWLVAVLDEWVWQEDPTEAGGRTPDEYLQSVSRETERFPFSNSNFLKNSFLLGCKTVGLFDPIATGNALQVAMPTNSPPAS